MAGASVTLVMRLALGSSECQPYACPQHSQLASANRAVRLPGETVSQQDLDDPGPGGVLGRPLAARKRAAMPSGSR